MSTRSTRCTRSKSACVRLAPMQKCAVDSLHVTFSYLELADVLATATTCKDTHRAANKLERGSFGPLTPLARRALLRYATTQRIVWVVQNLGVKSARQKAGLDSFASDEAICRFISCRNARDIVLAIDRKLKLVNLHQFDAGISSFAFSIISKALKYSSDRSFISFLISLYPWAVRSRHVLDALRAGQAFACELLVAARKHELHEQKKPAKLMLDVRLNSRTIMSVYARCDPPLLLFFLQSFIAQNRLDHCRDVHAFAFLYRGHGNPRVQAMLEIMRKRGGLQFQGEAQQTLVAQALADVDLISLVGIHNICESLLVFFKYISPLQPDTEAMIHKPLSRTHQLREVLVEAGLMHLKEGYSSRCPHHPPLNLALSEGEEDDNEEEDDNGGELLHAQQQEEYD